MTPELTCADKLEVLKNALARPDLDATLAENIRRITSGTAQGCVAGMMLGGMVNRTYSMLVGEADIAVVQLNLDARLNQPVN